MRILIFSTYFKPYISGAVNIPAYLSKYLARDNNQVTVLTFNYNQRLKSEEMIDTVSIRRCNYLFKISKGFISLQLMTTSLRLIRQSDIVILNLPNFEGLIIAILAYISRKKIIGIFNCWVDLEGSLFKKLINLILDFSMTIQLRLCMQIIPTTLDYAQNYLKAFSKKIKIAIFPPIEKKAVSREYFNKLKVVKKDYFVIGFIGRIAKEKGIIYLLDAVDKLNDSKIMLLIAGPSGPEVVGEDDYFIKIKDVLKSKKINYQFLGKLTDSELGAFYNIIDLLVLPSINKTEAFGIIQAEAMLFGKPVIASNLPGVRVPILETGMGIIIEPKNAKEIASAIQQIRSDYGTYITSEKIEKARKIFDCKTFYYNWLQVLNNLE